MQLRKHQHREGCCATEKTPAWTLYLESFTIPLCRITLALNSVRVKNVSMWIKKLEQNKMYLLSKASFVKLEPTCSSNMWIIANFYANMYGKWDYTFMCKKQEGAQFLNYTNNSYKPCLSYLFKPTRYKIFCNWAEVCLIKWSGMQTKSLFIKNVMTLFTCACKYLLKMWWFVMHKRHL